VFWVWFSLRAEKSDYGLMKREPGAEAPFLFSGFFAGLKPCAPPEVQRQLQRQRQQQKATATTKAKSRSLRGMTNKKGKSNSNNGDGNSKGKGRG
jgi:hypothetical protein